MAVVSCRSLDTIHGGPRAFLSHDPRWTDFDTPLLFVRGSFFNLARKWLDFFSFNRSSSITNFIFKVYRWSVRKPTKKKKVAKNVKLTMNVEGRERIYVKWIFIDIGSWSSPKIPCQDLLSLLVLTHFPLAFSLQWSFLSEYLQF